MSVVESVLRQDVQGYQQVAAGSNEVVPVQLLTAGTAIQPGNPDLQDAYLISGETNPTLMVEVVVPGDTQYLVPVVGLHEAIADAEPVS